MAAGLLIALALVSYFGFALLALSQDRHWLRAGGKQTCPARLAMPMRAAGYGLLLAALGLALLRDGPSFGSLLWVAMLTIAALCVVATLAWRAAWLRPVVRALQRIA
ncbi:DUF3325 domain-containing protein [Reyranella sp.]|uniref:DUF3325 domain-containing protein n=1 Tax=Reyranella sp. TaxID=1929291 RepID=UPI003D14455F